jgi:UDP-GlcNAc3NAcA epimerase
MINIFTVIGARPQIIKAAAISRAITDKYYKDIREILVHTGQHYSKNMFQVFIDELNIPEPKYNLKVGSTTHGLQTAKMIIGLEELLQIEKPDYVVLYGDTNSTLAGAIASSKMQIPIVHIEAGLRSYNKLMPEEINRIICDHTSSLLFSPTISGYKNLIKEGFNPENKPPYNQDNPGIFHCGDVMYDNSLYFSERAAKKSKILKKLNLESDEFILLTLHRDANTDNKDRLNSIFESIVEIANENQQKIIIPLHPRTTKSISLNLKSQTYKQLYTSSLINIIEPVSFFDMIELEKRAKLIMTDSGGVQKEAYFFRKPCIILRPQTEWSELVEVGSAFLVDTDKEKIIDAYYHCLNNVDFSFDTIFGDGHAAEFICDKIIKNQ